MYEEWFQAMIDDEDMPFAAGIIVMKSFINGEIPVTDAAEQYTSRTAQTSHRTLSSYGACANP